MTVSFALLVVASAVAEMLVDVLVLRSRLVAVNVAVVAPAATVTLPGTVAAAGFDEDSENVAPPDGAGDDNATVPTEFAAPPFTYDGERVSDENDGAFTFVDAVFETPPPVAVSVMDVFADTGLVGTETVAVVAPTANARVAGEFRADGFESESATE